MTVYLEPSPTPIATILVVKVVTEPSNGVTIPLVSANLPGAGQQWPLHG